MRGHRRRGRSGSAWKNRSGQVIDEQTMAKLIYFG
jgi:hypothetical protein